MPRSAQSPRPVSPVDTSHHFDSYADIDSRTLRRSFLTPQSPPPEVPLRSHLRNQTPHPNIRIVQRPLLPSPQVSRRQALGSRYDKRISLSSTASNTTCCASDESPLMRQLSESQRVKTRTFTRFYRLQYNFRFMPLPTIMPGTFEDTYYHQERLKEAEKELKFSKRYLEREGRMRNAEELREYNAETFAWNVGNALFCASRGMDEKVEREGRCDLVTGWSEGCLRKKAVMSERAAKRREGKAKAVKTLEVDDYTWRSGKARKAWLKRAEEGMKVDDMAKLRRQESMKAMDRAARILHSKTSREGLRKLRLPSSSASERTSRPTKLSTFVQGSPLRTSGLATSTKDGSNSDAWSDTGSDIYSVYSEHPEGIQYGPSSSGAKVVTMVRASSKPSLYTLKKANLSADTIRSET